MPLPIERGLAKTVAGHIHWQACGTAGPVVMVSHINQQSSALMIELLQALGTHFRATRIRAFFISPTQETTARPNRKKR